MQNLNVHKTTNGENLMGKKLLTVTIKGKHKTWCFDFYADPKYLEEWRADGLEIDVVINSGPIWVSELGLTEMWCFFQDIFHFKNPFK